MALSPKRLNVRQFDSISTVNLECDKECVLSDRIVTKAIRGLPILLGLAFVSVLGIHSFAAVMLFVTTKQLVKEATHIVIGDVVSKSSFMKDGRIYTRYVIDVCETLKGDVKEHRLELVEPGGVLAENHLGEKVMGAPDYREGEKIFAFLGPTQDGQALRAIELAQGRMFVQTGPDGQEYLVRPKSDAHSISIADFDSAGRNKVVCQCQILNLQPALPLKAYREEVNQYVTALKNGEDPPLSERELVLQKEIKALMERAPLDPKEQVLKFHFPVEKRGDRYVLKRSEPVPEPAPNATNPVAAAMGVPGTTSAGSSPPPPALGGGMTWGWHLFFILLIATLVALEIRAMRSRKRHQP